MEDYELTIETVKHYKNKACAMVNGDCNKCEAMYKYCDKQWCSFDTVIRFIKWDNEYNK